MNYRITKPSKNNHKNTLGLCPRSEIRDSSATLCTGTDVRVCLASARSARNTCEEASPTEKGLLLETANPASRTSQR